MVRHRCFLRSGAVWDGIGLLMLLPSTTFGVVVAYDAPNPADAAYADGWDEGDNGGTGFLPWTGGMYANPFEIDGDPQNPQPDNNIGAPAFRYGTGGSGYWAVRPFAAPIAAGQTFSMDFDAFDFPAATNGQFQSLIRFGSTGGERFALYAYSYHLSGTVAFGSDSWGVGGDTANNNLNGGAPLPTTPCYATGCTTYSMLDASDGFSMSLDILTLDTYRFRIVDDGVTKVDVSGNLKGGALSGQGISSITLWTEDPTNQINSAYFSKLKIATTEVVGVPGDYNNDGKVNAADYVLWRKGGPLANQVDDPNTVNAADYTAWRARYGNPSGSGSSLDGAAIPEPTSWLLALLGSAMMAGLRRSR